jgi:hypothetical protein
MKKLKLKMLFLLSLFNLNNKALLKYRALTYKPQMLLFRINHKVKQLCNYLIKYYLDLVRFVTKFKDQTLLSQVLLCHSLQLSEML